MNAPLVPVTLAFTAGIMFALYVAVRPLVLMVGGVLCVLAALYPRATDRWKLIGVCLFWSILGMLRLLIWQAHPDGQLRAMLPDQPQQVRLHGVVTDSPAEMFSPGDLEGGSEPNAYLTTPRLPSKQTCTIHLDCLSLNGRWRRVSGRVWISLEKPRVCLRYGDEVLIEGRWSAVPPSGNPGQYDWRAALARSQIYSRVRVMPFDGIHVLAHHRGCWWIALGFNLRQRWERLIRETFSDRDSGLLLSLLLGERVALDERLREAFVETGTVHLLVVSGFNVGLVAGLLEMFLRLLGVSWRGRLLCSAAGVGLYCVITGLQPPVVRAALMAWVVLGALALDRVVSWPNTLAASGLAMLWVDPMQLCDPGFQLSFGAVASLLVFARGWHRLIVDHLQWVRPSWLSRYLSASLAASTAVWTGLTPLLLWYFSLISPGAMIANLLVTPLVSLLIYAGTAILIVGSGFSGVVSWSRGILSVLLEAVRWAVLFCRNIPGSCWVIGRPALLLVLGYYGVLGIWTMGRRRGWSFGRLLICWVALFDVWLWSAVLNQWKASSWLQVDILDVGHGDSILVRTPHGRTVLVDAGSEEAGRYRVGPFLRWSGISALDALLLTHTDADHIGGAIGLLSHLRVGVLLTNGVRGDTMCARRVDRLAAQQRLQRRVVSSGMRLQDGCGVICEVLHPPPGLTPHAPAISNDNAIVLRVTYGSVSFLFCSDIEEAGLSWLLENGLVLRSNVLKVPHHGSRLGSVGERFFDAVQARVAIISVGDEHDLPALETIQALERRGVDLYLTRDDGAVRMRTDGQHVEVKTFRFGIGRGSGH